jgi:hypothetical protein
MHGTLSQLSWLADERIMRLTSASFVSDSGEFPSVGHKLGTFFRVCAIDAKDLVVGAGHERVLGLLVRLVAIPNSDPLKAEDGGLVVFRQRHIDAAAFTIDAAASTPQPKRISLPASSVTTWPQEPLESKLAVR